MKQRVLWAAVVIVALALIGWRGAFTLRQRNPLVIWHKSITQGADVPMRAELTLTWRRHGITHITQAHVVQGSGGQYRMEYLQPEEARGRVVYSDGHTNWQYEPRKNLLARTTLIPENEQNERDTEDLIKQNYRVVLVSDQEVVQGRTTFLLELLPKHSGKSTQRRWIDRATFKTLRVETHYTDGILARSIAYQPIALPAQVSNSEFLPVQTPGLRSVASPGESAVLPAANRGDCASSLGLKAEGALGFQVTQVASSSLDKNRSAHLLYSDGIESVSVFVQKSNLTANPVAANWHPVTIEGHPAFENLDGHLDAVAWIQMGKRYTALSHLEPKALRLFVAGQMNAHPGIY